MSKFGIDVSQHQTTIDWNSVKVDFAILRLGWIGNKNNHTIDTYFERNYNECKRLGIPVGVYAYCYCNSVDTIKQGAEWTIKQLQGKKLDLPVYIDMEDSSIKVLGRDVLTQMCVEYNSIIEKNGYWAGVYANLDWFNNYLHKDILKQKYTTWIAHYTAGTNKHEGEYDMWQNSSCGKIAGIKGNCDTNYMYRDLIKEMNGAVIEKPIVEEKKEEFEMAKIYRNGSTVEKVFADTDLKKHTGTLNKWEVCECLGIVNGKYLVKYRVDGTKTNNYKCGFVKYNGGIK